MLLSNFKPQAGLFMTKRTPVEHAAALIVDSHKKNRFRRHILFQTSTGVLKTHRYRRCMTNEDIPRLYPSLDPELVPEAARDLDLSHEVKANLNPSLKADLELKGKVPQQQRIPEINNNKEFLNKLVNFLR